MNATTKRLAYAAEDILFSGEYDDCGSYIIRNTDGADSIDEIDELSEALREFHEENVVATQQAVDEWSWWKQIGNGINVLVYLVGVIYLIQQAATLGTWLGIHYGF